MKPTETKYKGCRFRSRLEARWAVFFDTLSIKWWYEPERFDLQFDLAEFVSASDGEILPQLAEHHRSLIESLDGKKYWYLPDFYLPELNYWIEVKGPLPVREEREKVFLLHDAIYYATRDKIQEPTTDADSAWNDFETASVYVFHGDIPWPYPQEGNALGYPDRTFDAHGYGEVEFADHSEYLALDGLCWKQCPLCGRLGIGKLGIPGCDACCDEMDLQIFRTGHQTPQLRDAYAAARSARFFP